MILTSSMCCMSTQQRGEAISLNGLLDSRMKLYSYVLTLIFWLRIRDTYMVSGQLD